MTNLTIVFNIDVAISHDGESIFVSINDSSSYLQYSNDFGESFHEFGFKSNWGQLSSTPTGDILYAVGGLEMSSMHMFERRNGQWMELGRQLDPKIELSVTLQGPQGNISVPGNSSVPGSYQGSTHRGLTKSGIVLVCISFLGIALLLLSVTYYYFRDKGLLRFATCSRSAAGTRPLPVADVERVTPSVCVSVNSFEDDESDPVSTDVPTADATQLTGLIPLDKAAKLESWKAEGSLSDVEFIIARRILTNESGINGSFMRDLRHAVHSHKAGEISDRDFLLAKSRILLSLTDNEDYEIDSV